MEETSGSHYALKIALQTMKERCYQLQQRLTELEEENYTLKLKLNRENKESVSNLNTISEEHLREQVCLLAKQNDQLSHNIHMVAKENKSLWERLSKLSETNHSLGSHFSKIIETLNKHDSNLTRSQMQDLLDKNILDDSLQKSLEDISLKLINGILLEKTELEKQCNEMADLQNDNKAIDIQDFRFAFPGEDDGSVLNDMQNHYERLKQYKNMLATERSTLKFLLQNLKENNVNVPKVQTCDSSTDDRLPSNVHYTQSSTIVMTEETNVELRTCPMCSHQFSLPMNQFADHVSSHFEDEVNSFQFVG